MVGPFYYIYLPIYYDVNHCYILIVVAKLA